jgi:hypothetical protein
MSLDERDYMKRNRRANPNTSYPSKSIGYVHVMAKNIKTEPAKPVIKKKSWIRRMRDFLCI